MYRIIKANKEDHSLLLENGDNKKYKVKIKKAFDIGEGAISLDKIKYEFLINRIVGLCERTEENLYTLPSGAYFFIVEAIDTKEILYD